MMGVGFLLKLKEKDEEEEDEEGEDEEEEERWKEVVWASAWRMCKFQRQRSQRGDSEQRHQSVYIWASKLR